MILYMHIIIAIVSLMSAAVTYASPSQRKLHASYIFIVLTVLSGGYLIATSAGSHMAEACLVGVMYLGVASLGVTAARRKLASVAAFYRQTKLR